MIWGKKKVDLLTIGDIAVDAFIRIPEIKGLCEVDKKNSKLNLDFADKIPYEFDEIKFKRETNAKLQTADNTPERLLVKEQVTKAKLQKLKRNLT